MEKNSEVKRTESPRHPSEPPMAVPGCKRSLLTVGVSGWEPTAPIQRDSIGGPDQKIFDFQEKPSILHRPSGDAEKRFEINKKKRVKKKNDDEPLNNIQIFIEDDVVPEESENILEPAKKRGRKPKGGKLTLNCQKKNETVNSIANIILHLKCSINDLSEYNNKLHKMVKYPLEYDPTVPPDIYTYSNMDNTTPFSMYEQDRHTSENKASSIVDQCMLQTPTSYLDSINYSRLNEPTELDLGRFTEGYRPGVKHNNDGERSSESLQELVSHTVSKQSFQSGTTHLQCGGSEEHPTQLLNSQRMKETLSMCSDEKFGAKDGVIGAFLSFSEARENNVRLAHMDPTNLDNIRPSLGEHRPEEFGQRINDSTLLTSILGMERLDSRSLCTEQGGPHSGSDALGSDALGASTLNASGVLRHPKPEWRLNQDIPAYTDTAFFTQKNQHINVLDGTIATEVASDIAKAECDTTNMKDINTKLKRLKIHLYKNHNYEKKSACFWCTYDYDNPTCYIPKYEMDDKIYGYGSFCRPECAVAYLMKENIDDSMKFERYHLLNQIYSKVYNFKKNIKPAPNPYYLLEKYYGNLTIQEYRKLLKTEHMLLVIDKPLTRILPELHEDNEDILLNTYASGNSNHTVQNNTGVYKVKRSSDKTAGPSKSSIIKDIFT